MNTNQSLGSRVGSFVVKNSVTVLFVILCVGSFIISGKSLSFLLPELFTRIGRNTFLVLSLLIPVIAGMGLNFGIVIGAIATQISIFWVVLWGLKGMAGIIACMAMSTVLSIFFGYLAGKLFNRMKGSEMIGGMVLSYFTEGLYQLLFLFIIGGVIPIVSAQLIIPGGVGVKNTIDLKDSLRYAIDNVSMLSIVEVAFYAVVVITVLQLAYRLIKKQDLGIKKLAIRLAAVGVIFGCSFIPFIEKFLNTPRLMLLNAIEIGVVLAAIYGLGSIVRKKMIKKEPGTPKKEIITLVVAAGVYALTYVPSVYTAIKLVQLPVLTYLLIGCLYMFMPWFMNTKLGQDMRTVGHSMTVANSAGINVDRTRIIAMIMSTVFASYGQLISLQNIGTMATYGAHVQVGQFAIAALLVGGASVQQANQKQALLGVILFHTLFILSPIAGQALLGNAQIGEYFRVFIAYGVIAVALALHAWKGRGGKKKAETSSDETPDVPHPSPGPEPTET